MASRAWLGPWKPVKSLIRYSNNATCCQAGRAGLGHIMSGTESDCQYCLEQEVHLIAVASVIFVRYMIVMTCKCDYCTEQHPVQGLLFELYTNGKTFLLANTVRDRIFNDAISCCAHKCRQDFLYKTQSKYGQLIVLHMKHSLVPVLLMICLQTTFTILPVCHTNLAPLYVLHINSWRQAFPIIILPTPLNCVHDANLWHHSCLIQETLYRLLQED